MGDTAQIDFENLPVGLAKLKGAGELGNSAREGKGQGHGK